MRSVLYVSATAWLGGAELSLFGLLAALDRRRYRPLLALPEFIPAARGETDTTRARRAEHDLGIVCGRLGVEIRRIPILPPVRPRTPAAALRLWREWRRNRERVAELVRARDVALIHANSPAAALQCEGAPLISHWRDWRLPHPVAWRLGGFVSTWIVPSQALAERAAAFGWTAIRRVPNGIDIDHFRPAGVRPRSERVAAFAPSPAHAGDRRSRRLTPVDAFVRVLPPTVPAPLDPDELDPAALRALEKKAASGPVLLVAHQVPWKRHDLFLRAVAWLRARRPETRARVAGLPPPGSGDRHAAELQRLCYKLGLDGVVEWLGQVPYSEMPDLYRSSSVLIHPAAGEPWGRSVAEALACGTPVVAAAAPGGPVELLSRGGGVLAAPEDPEAFGRAALAWIDRPEARSVAGRAGRAAAESWSLERHAESIMEIYDQHR